MYLKGGRQFKARFFFFYYYFTNIINVLCEYRNFFSLLLHLFKLTLLKPLKRGDSFATFKIH